MKLKTTPTVKLIILCFFALVLTSAYIVKHPFYMSVSEIKYDAQQKTLQISIKQFTSDLETALRKVSGKKIDILHPKVKSEVDTTLFKYIDKRFQMKVNNKLCQLKYIGYEKEEEAIWTYLEVENIDLPKKVEISDGLLYDYISQQINLVKFTVGANTQSSKCTNPSKEISFSF